MISPQRLKHVRSLIHEQDILFETIQYLKEQRDKLDHVLMCYELESPGILLSCQNVDPAISVEDDFRPTTNLVSGAHDAALNT